MITMSPTKPNLTFYP